jgi:mannose-6-phosphate isomerase-like protein (cupin superfamily)
MPKAKAAKAKAAKAKTAKATTSKAKAAKAKTAKATTSKAKAKARSSARAASRSQASRGRTRPVSKAKPKARPKQRFTASHFREEDFQTGLRRYAAYRDLGISDATGGMVQAHVIRFVPPCRPEEVSKLHFHEVDFQMVYVLKGWIKSEFAGEGAIVMRTGSCWIQPPRIEHKVLDYSDDCEVLEIILPADFKTVELE